MSFDSVAGAFAPAAAPCAGAGVPASFFTSAVLAAASFFSTALSGFGGGGASGLRKRSGTPLAANWPAPTHAPSSLLQRYSFLQRRWIWR